MKLNKIIVWVITLALLVSAIVIIPQEKTMSALPLAVRTVFNGKTEQIKCWENSQEECYIFLPAYLDLSDVKIDLLTENDVSINGVELYDNMSCGEFSLDTDYDFTYESFGKTNKKKITFVKSANVPTMYIDTESGGMEYIHGKKENAESGTISLYNSYGNLDYTGDISSIKGRGNYTWEGFDKKPYNIELAENADLLEMGQAKKWVLLANADDPSNLRNKIVFDFAEAVGLEYSPDSEWVDLYLNGEYVGLYLLCEKNEVHSQRIDVSENDSFIVSLELESRLLAQNRTYISTENGQPLRVHYPLENNNDSLAELTVLWQSVENAILAGDGIDPSTGKHWNELIDLDSWAKKYLIEEIFGNYDAGFISQFFYCNNIGDQEKVYAGPVWDFDHAMGNRVLWQLENPKTLFANRLKVKDGFNTPWLYSLYRKEEFYIRMVELYRNEYLPLLNNLLNNGINNYAVQISKAAALNKVRWFDNESNDIFAESEYISNYMKERLSFLSSIWCDSKEYCTVRVDSNQGLYYVNLSVFKGECLEKTPSINETEFKNFLGWYYTDTDEPFDITRPIYEDTAIYAKWQDTAKNRIDDIVKLIPLAVIAVIFIVLFVIEIKRMKGNR